MEVLPPIPTPRSQKWREFRIRFLPVIVFTLTLAAIALVWRQSVLPPTLVAQAESMVADVMPPEGGFITNLFVQPYQYVQAGQVIAEVVSTENRAIDAELQILRTELSLAQLQLDAVRDRQRLSLDYQRLNNDYLQQLADLRVAEAELPFAEQALAIAHRLRDENLFSDLDLETYASRVGILKAQVAQLKENVATLEGAVAERPEISDAPVQSQLDQVLLRLEELQLKARRLELAARQPIPLKAPRSGNVISIMRQQGETVLEGEPIVRIGAVQSDRILAYLRQPMSFIPEQGMTVRVRTRSWQRAEAEAEILAVGAQFEVITNVVLFRPGAPLEVGLPIAVSMPEPLRALVRPGELLDIRFLSQ